MSVLRSVSTWISGVAAEGSARHNVRAMDSSALDTFRAFRSSLYNCLHRRSDALFELTDAILTAEPVPSPVHLSLQPSHRRGWGSLYNALSRGRIDAEALRSSAEAARSPSASSWSWKRNARLRRGRKRVAPLRRGEQPRAWFLLSSLPTLGRPAHRSGLGLPVHRPAQLRPRELDRPRGRGARPTRAGRQRGGRRAGESVPPPVA